MSLSNMSLTDLNLPTSLGSAGSLASLLPSSMSIEGLDQLTGGESFSSAGPSPPVASATSSTYSQQDVRNGNQPAGARGSTTHYKRNANGTVHKTTNPPAAWTQQQSGEANAPNQMQAFANQGRASASRLNSMSSGLSLSSAGSFPSASQLQSVGAAGSPTGGLGAMSNVIGFAGAGGETSAGGIGNTSFKSPEDWLPDDKATTCCRSGCKVRFGVLRRKHHCRICGKIFCAGCCPKRKRYFGNRVCADCDNTLPGAEGGAATRYRSMLLLLLPWTHKVF